MITFYSAVVTLFFVIDPLGNIPLFLSILKAVPAKKRRRIIMREALIALLVLILFLFFGRYLLAGMHISQPALAIAGGIILFLIAIRMIFPGETHLEKHGPRAVEPFIFPLAVPLIAGPSSMTMVMLLTTEGHAIALYWLLVLFLAWFISTLILLFADHIGHVLGERGLLAIERLMGMILTTMAVQMFLDGLLPLLHR